MPAVVIEMLGVYGISNVTADLKQHTPNLQSVAVLASPWNPQPAGCFQLRTGKYLRKKGFLSVPESGAASRRCLFKNLSASGSVVS